MSLTGQLTAQLARLTPANQKLAHYVLAQPERFMTQTAAQIAAACGVSAATTVRFVRVFHYSNLQAFKLALAKERPEAQPAQLDLLVQAQDDLPTIVAKLAAGYTANTQALQGQLDLNSLAQAVAVLQHAKRVLPLGVGASALAAQDLYQKLLRAGVTTSFDADIHTAVEQMYYVQPKRDVVVAYSYSGLTTEVLLAARTAHARGVPVIAVCRNAANPLAASADFVLGLPADEQLLRIGAVTSLYDEVFVGDLLFLGAFKRRLGKLTQNYRATKQLLGALKEDGNG